MCEMAVMLFSKSYFKLNFFTKFLCLSQVHVSCWQAVEDIEQERRLFLVPFLETFLLFMLLAELYVLIAG